MLTDAYKEILGLLVVAVGDVEAARRASQAAEAILQSAVERMSRLQTAVENLAQLPEVQAVLQVDKKTAADPQL